MTEDMAGAARDVVAAEFPADPTEVVDEIQALLWRSVSPYHPPTSAELRERLPKLARLLSHYRDDVGLSEDEACSIFEMFVSHLLETQLRERLAEALSGTSVAEERVRSHRFGRFGRFSMAYRV